MRRSLLLCLLCAALLGGCGGGDRTPLPERVQRLQADARHLRDQIRDEAHRVGKRLSDRVQAALDELERSVPRATPQTRPPSSAGHDGTDEIDTFLTSTLRSIDSYWTRTFAANGLPEPRVGYDWVPVGRSVSTGCGADADDTAAFYCPEDDTIYVGRRIATGVIGGVAEGFPGQQAGYGHAVGDFGVAYIIAHEYAHNLQNELGFFSATRQGASAEPFELQADCLAGVWGASVYHEGLLHPGDIEDALNTTLAVGDFEVNSPQHHGTPEERRDAWQLGFSSGEPSSCRDFVRA